MNFFGVLFAGIKRGEKIKKICFDMDKQYLASLKKSVKMEEILG